MRLRATGLAAALGMVAALTLPGPASAHDGGHHGGHDGGHDGGQHGGRPLSATLKGVSETPFAGDPDGSGTATLRLNPGQGSICFELKVTGISLPAAGAGIFKGPSGVSGTLVASLLPPTTSGGSEGCVSAPHDALMSMMWNPSAYYVNVFTTDFPNGALRGQLGKGFATSTTGDQTFSASLSGASEALNKGDPDGRGSASVRVMSSLNQICYSISVTGIWLPATAAYIQQGPPGTVGPVVVALTPPNVSGLSSGCVAGLPVGLASAILATPSAYYVNVVTYDFPGGALRGQLGCAKQGDDRASMSARHPGGGSGCGGDDQGDDDQGEDD